MEKSDDDELHRFLIEAGLSDPKWLHFFHDAEISHPDQLCANEKGEEWHKSALALANPEEQEALINLLSMEETSTFEKVYLALEAAGLDPVYWSKVLAFQAGVVTEQALNFIEDEFYPHLVQFARFPAEKRALRKLLNIEDMGDNFSAQYEKQLKSFQKRKAEILLCLSKLKEYETEGKTFDLTEVQEVKQRALECLQVPKEFWFQENTFEGFIQRMEHFICQISGVLDKRDLLDDSAVVETASSGCVLKGVLLCCDKTAQSTKCVLQISNDVSLHRPFYSQHVKQVLLSKMATEISLEQELFSGHYSNKPTAECSTIKSFIVPVASCILQLSQLKLTDEVIERLKQLEELIKTDALSITTECKRFFNEFGSHARLGPFHFGGYYHWCCSTYNVEAADLNNAHSLQSEIIQHQGTAYIDVTGVNSVELHPDVISDNPLLQHTSIKVGMTGGSQLSSVALWRNSLLVKNSSWVLLDGGTEYVPLWEIAERNHTHEFKDIPSIAKAMQSVWRNTNTSMKKSKSSAHLQELVEVITQWIEFEDKMEHCEELLSIMLRKKQDVLKEEVDPYIWPTYFLSETTVQMCLSLLLNMLKQKDTTAQMIQGLLCQIVGPIDLEGIHNFSQRDLFRQLVFETDEPFAIAGYEDVIIMAKICRLASDLLPTGKASNEIDFQLVSYPNKSLRTTALLTKNISYVRSHLQNTRQVYDEIFVLTLLTPFNYKQESNVFLSAITALDMKYLAEEIEEQTKAFFSMKVQKEETKLQAHLILLTLNMYTKWDVTTSNLQSHLQFILKSIPSDHVDENLTKILTSLMRNTRRINWARTRLQYIMKGIPIEQNNAVLVKLLDVDVKESDTEEEPEISSTYDNEYVKFFAMLKLSDYIFPTKNYFRASITSQNRDPGFCK